MLDRKAQPVDIARICAAKPPEPWPADTELVSEAKWVAQILVEPQRGYRGLTVRSVAGRVHNVCSTRAISQFPDRQSAERRGRRAVRRAWTGKGPSPGTDIRFARVMQARAMQGTEHMRPTVVTLVAAAILAVLSVPYATAADRDTGWYGGIEVGGGKPGALRILGQSDDVPTNCDGHFPPVEINGQALPLPLSHADCNQGTEEWTNELHVEVGSLLGLQWGYAWPAVRIEAEYLRRRHGRRGGNVAVVGGKQAEFVLGEERLDALEADELFGNVYYGLRGAWGDFWPYVGAGIGLISAKLAYRSAYRRNADAAVLRGLGRHPAAAGTLSLQDATLVDHLRAYQVVLGIDRPLADGVVLGIKARRVVVVDAFADSGSPSLLRGHAPTVAPGGRQVVNTITADDLGYWGVSLSVKYFF